MNNSNSNVSPKDRRRRNQQREDDDEDFVAGDRRNRGNDPSSSQGINIALGALGVAVLGLGAYVTKKYFGSSDGDKTSSCASTEEQCVKLLRKMQRDIDEFPVIGLDCQWTQTFDSQRSRIALLQFCTHKGNILLIPMKKYALPDEVKLLLRNPNVIKVGIEGVKDAQHLRKDYDIEVRSTFDLRFLAESTGNRPEGLEKLSKSVLSLDLGKDWELIKSDWDVLTLQSNQVAYAEKAVKAAIDIFTTLFVFISPNEDKAETWIFCSPKLDKAFVWKSEKWGSQVGN